MHDRGELLAALGVVHRRQRLDVLCHPDGLPRPDGQQDLPQVATAVGERVLVAPRRLRVLGHGEHAGLGEAAQPDGQDRVGDAQPVAEVLVPAHAFHDGQLDDGQVPLIADQPEDDGVGVLGDLSPGFSVFESWGRRNMGLGNNSANLAVSPRFTSPRWTRRAPSSCACHWRSARAAELARSGRGRRRRPGTRRTPRRPCSCRP